MTLLSTVVKRVIIFDLDDTLYLEQRFAFSGYNAVGAWMADNYGINDFADRCTTQFNSGIQQNIFNHVCAELGIPEATTLIAELVEIYRTHIPKINLEPDAKRYLDTAKGLHSLGLITDGIAQTQANKIDALDLEPYLDWIVRTGVWGREYWKPHPRAYEQIETLSQAKPKDIVYVADNAAKDFLTPNTRGWISIQIQRKLGIHKALPINPDYKPQAIINSFDDLDDCLARI